MAVLDTSFLIDLDEGHPGADRLLRHYHAQGERLILPAMAAAQYLTGSTNALITLSRLRSSFELMPMGPDEIMEASRLARLAKARKLRPHWADLSIAAAATLHGTHVVTANPDDFASVDVPVVNHREEESPGAAA